MLLSEMVDKELIQVEGGVHFGILAHTECLLDVQTGKIHGFEILKEKGPFQKKKMKVSEMIPWQEIILIGEDRILFNKTTTVQSEFLD
ncbi:YlmC/YmxH family sporulation protein [Lysinibacillus sp. NPDC096418]|uniref:YlmC/YmxH family sporulation protein n=1 Tax=Lysinibacillus sp. NPDC096418 TaxID=3364138 RepID=UPI0037F79A62